MSVELGGPQAARMRVTAVVQAIAVLVPASLAIVLAKAALPSVRPLSFVSLQILLGAGMLLLLAALQGKLRLPRGLSRRSWACIVAIGIANFAIARVMILLALERLPATTNVYLSNFVGVVTMLLSVLLLRERPSLYQGLGALIALFGLRIFFRDVPAPTEMLGVLFIGIGVLALASTNILGRMLASGREHIPSFTVALWAVLLAGVPAASVLLALQWPLEPLGLRLWAILCLNAAASIVLGLTVWLRVLRTLRAYEASVLATLGVVFTALFAIPILGEHLELHELVGIGCMLIGLSLAQFRRAVYSGRSFRR